MRVQFLKKFVVKGYHKVSTLRSVKQFCFQNHALCEPNDWYFGSSRGAISKTISPRGGGAGNGLTILPRYRDGRFGIFYSIPGRRT